MATLTNPLAPQLTGTLSAADVVFDKFFRI